ncbi:MAG: putative repeat protein (TIGR01451 family) [Candidatus Azotimanducaceae bacterium]|jgi:uncharacterized repeat protein (TIGR01451 family)
MSEASSLSNPNPRCCRVPKSYLAFAILLLLAFSEMASAASWPTDGDWLPVLRGGSSIQDDDTDFQTHINFVGPGSTSIYMFNDGNQLQFRFRLDATPLTNQNGLKSFGWGTLFDIDGDANSYEYMLMLDGISEELYIAKNTSPTSIGDPSDKAETILWQQAATQGLSGNYRVTQTTDSNFSGNPDFFLDFRAPYSVIKAALGIDDNDLLRLFFGTSASAQTLSKDLSGSDLINGSSDFTLPSGAAPSTASILFVQSLAGTVEDDQFLASETLFIRVIDDDQNTVKSSAQTILATVSAPSGDSADVTLVETGPDTGIFTGSIGTAAGSPVVDNILQVTPVEIITATYVDANDGNYNINITRTDTIQALPAADLGISVAVANLTEPARGSTPNEGDQITYTYTLTNNGPSTSFSAQVNVLSNYLAITAAPGQSGTGFTFNSKLVANGNSYSASTGLWSVGNLGVGASTTLVLTLTVQTGTADQSISTTANISAAAQPDSNSTNNSTTTVLSIEGADLAVTKTINGGNNAPNQNDLVTFTIAVTNNGDATATGVVVTDLLPTGLNFSTATPSTGFYNNGTGEWSVGTLLKLDSATLALQATVTASAGTQIENTATVNGAEADPVTANNSASVILVVGATDLSMTKTVDNASPSEGASITYTLTATNNSLNAATGVIVTDLLPSGLTFSSASPSSGSYNSGTGAWTIGALSASGVATMSLVATVNANTAGTTITNTASITGNEQDDNTANDTANVPITVTYADIQVTKTANVTAVANGDIVRFTITATNNGPANATAVEITDYFPSYLINLTEVSNQGGTFNTTTGVWQVGAMNNGSSVALVFDAEINVRNSDPDSFFNSASVTASSEADIITNNNTDSVALKVDGTDLEVFISVAPDNTPSEGDALTYVVTYVNNGANVASGVTINALIPTGLTYVSHTNISDSDPSLGTYSTGAGTWTMGNNESLAVGETATLTIQVTVNAGTSGLTLTSNANIAATDQGDTNTANDSASTFVTVGAADLALTKTVDDTTPNAGENVTFTITLTNNGPNGVAAVTVTDQLPTGLQFVSASTANGSYNDATGEWITTSAIPNGGSATLTIIATALSSAAGSTLTNTATITSSSGVDTNTGDNSAQAAVTVQLSDLSISKLVSNSAPSVGGTTTYSIFVTNLGPHPADGVNIADVINCNGESSPCVTFLGGSTNASIGTYDPNTGIWSLGSINKDVTETLTFTVTVGGAVGSDIDNTATVTANQTDNNPGNNSSTITISPAEPSDLSTSTKVVTNVGDINAGDIITYQITLINTSAADAIGVTLSDTLQSNLTFDSASTSCTDEFAAALSAPSASGQIVTLNNIFVPGNGSCTVTIDAQVDLGASIGDLIDNSAIITNPTGLGASPRVVTTILSESQVAAVVGKQLYLENIGTSKDLLRPRPTSASSSVVSGSPLSLILPGTVREMVLPVDTIGANVYLDSNGVSDGALRSVTVTIRANDGNGAFVIGSQTRIVQLDATPILYAFRINNPSLRTMSVGSTFQVDITNNETDINLPIKVSQTTAAPFSELVVPLNNAIEVTSLAFFDKSATDETDAPGCAVTFSCATEISSAQIVNGQSVWVQAVIADAFGSADVNTGCESITSTNCPVIGVTDPTPADQTPTLNSLSYIDAPNSAARRFEIELTPGGMGLEGTWVIDVLGNEGVEGVYEATDQVNLVVFGQPSLTVVKSVIGTPDPLSIMTYQNAITNNGAGPALTVLISNSLGDFISLELTDSGGTWTAVNFLSAGYSVSSESFDNGNGTFTYDPDTEGVCTLPQPPPCYDPEIRAWRVQLNENLEAAASLNQKYQARIQ